eukprot:gene28649-31819_t
MTASFAALISAPARTRAVAVASSTPRCSHFSLHVKQLPNARPQLNPRCPVSCRAAGSADGRYGSDGLSEEQLAAAYDEAAMLFSAAQSISNIQIRQELAQNFPKDVFYSDDLALTHDQVANFFIEQGLSSYEANRLYLELHGQGRSYTLSQLSSKVSRWTRVLPDVDVGRMAFKDSLILDADVGLGLVNMIKLVEAFPGRDIISMLVKQPRLLWCEDLVPRLEQAWSQLINIHPSGDRDVVLDIILEYPELVYRMEYYTEATLIDELPIEIQNMMVVADQGIGYIFRYYQNKATNYQSEGDYRSHTQFVQDQ